MNSQDYIYLDWAATSPLSCAARDALLPFFVEGGEGIGANANPNSLHSAGRHAFAMLEQARATIARCVGARPDEIIFTSCATEATNAAIFGIIEASVNAKKLQGQADFVPHFITSSIEHDATLDVAKRLAQKGVQVSYLDPDSSGFISAEAVSKAIQENTVLASFHYVNNEIGCIQNVEQMCAVAKRHGIYLHTDAVQALGKLPINFKSLNVHAASLSGHKVGAPKGVGVMYLRVRTPFVTQMLGGGQESGMRSGTQNVAGAVAMAAAVKDVTENLEEACAGMTELRDYCAREIANMPGCVLSVDLLGQPSKFAPHIVNFCVKGHESQTLILRLDKQGIALSSASACSQATLKPSHVLSKLGLPAKLSQGSLRVSFGASTTKDQVEQFLSALRNCVSSS